MHSIDVWREIIEMKRQLRRLQTGEYLTTGSWQTAISVYLTLPELRAFWPFSSVNESGNIIDLSGQGRTLTNNGGATRTTTTGGFPCVNLDGSSQYFSRADEAGLDITGGLTIGAWVWPGVVDATLRGIIAKWNATGDQRSYQLYFNSTFTSFGVSSDGTAGGLAHVNGPAMTASTWHLVVGRFYPSNNVFVLVDEQWTSNETSIPAAAYSGTAALEIGRQTGYLNGAIALPFVCAGVLKLAHIKSIFQKTRVMFGV